MDDPPDVATFLAHVMTGGGDDIKAPNTASRIVRMNPMISPVRGPDGWRPRGPLDTQEFIDMINLPVDAIDQVEVDKITAYTKLWIAGSVPNQPIREDIRTLQLELGDAQFKQAVGSWQTLKHFY
jgi:hypothetical protein